MSGTIDPGALRHRLALEAEAQAPDGYGGFATNWVHQFDVWAAIRPLSATRDEEAGNRVHAITHEITIRSRDGISAGMRLMNSGSNYLIDTLHDPDGTGRYLLCRTIEKS